jgi:hypothetical protein
MGSPGVRLGPLDPLAALEHTHKRSISQAVVRLSRVHLEVVGQRLGARDRQSEREMPIMSP